MDVERWWMRRWRRGLLAHAHLEVEAKDRSGDVSARGGFEPDAAAVAAGEWPPQIPRSPATRKGPLPGGVDPEGILATVPLAADIVDALSREDTDEVGPAVEAVETLVAHGNGRFLLVPEAAKVIPTLIRHVATARARWNGRARTAGNSRRRRIRERRRKATNGKTRRTGRRLPKDEKEETDETEARTRRRRRRRSSLSRRRTFALETRFWCTRCIL